MGIATLLTTHIAGAFLVESTGIVDGIHHIAFENPDGTCVLILINSGSSVHKVQCSLRSERIAVLIEPDSVMTILWH